MPSLRTHFDPRIRQHPVGWCAWLRSIALAAACAVGLPVQADEAPAPAPAPVQLTPNVYFSPGAEASAPNLAFVVTNNSVVLIDAPGSASLAAQWLTQMRRVTPKPLSHVLLTGPAADAAEGLAALKGAGAVIVAQRAAQPIDPADIPAAAGVTEASPHTAADLWLDDSTDLLIGGMHFQAERLGPADGADARSQRFVYVLPDEAVLFAGALVAADTIPDVGQADTRAWIAALDALLKLDAQVLVPSLGAPTSPPAPALVATRDYLAWLREAMGEALRQNEPFDAAYDKIDWSRYAELAQFGAFNRSNASAVYTRMQRDGG
jgi:glyoxylase-like metal-dependent hydrolase (beta-lactamase superfamily II)